MIKASKNKVVSDENEQKSILFLEIETVENWHKLNVLFEVLTR